MMDTRLKDQLEALAAPAADGAGDSAGELWSRGMTYRRRRRGSLVLGLGAVVLAALVLLTALPRAQVDLGPADERATLRVPDRFWAPSPWLPGTDSTGPIGPLVAVFTTIRKSGLRGTETNGIVGVSASGAYAFLDLPGLAPVEAGPVQVSPDGRYVAYWYAGEGRTASVFDGLAVHDTVTGRTQRHAVASDHGLSPQDLVWVGDTIWASIGRYAADPSADSMLSRTEEGLVWALGAGSPRTVPVGDLPELNYVSQWGDLVVTEVGGVMRIHAQDRTARGTVPLRLPQKGEIAGPVYLSPSGRTVAALWSDGASTQSEPASIRIVPVRIGGPPPQSLGAEVSEVLGWQDEEHVLAASVSDDGITIDSVDVRTGEKETISTVDGPRPRLTAASLTGGTFEASEPASPVDPRITVGVASFLALAGLGGAIIWRRRVQI